LRFRVPVTAGSHLVQVYFIQKTSAVLEDLFDPYLRRDPYRAGNGEPGISSLTITGPLASDATSIVESPSRRRRRTGATARNRSSQRSRGAPTAGRSPRKISGSRSPDIATVRARPAA